MAWLVRDGRVLASLTVAEDRATRRRGLLGRDGIDGALLLRPCRSVHTIGMRFPIDVAHLDAGGRVLRTATMAPWRLGPWVPKAAAVLEAEAGAFRSWELGAGDEIEIRD